ncbi:MAG: type II secretion system protein GspM [Panacagrimonas sp.]
MNKALQPLQQRLDVLRDRYLAAPPRERWLMGVGAVVVTLTLIYLLIWEPLIKSHQRNQAALEASRALAVKLEQAAGQLNSGPVQTLQGQHQSLLSVVDQAIKQSGIGKAPERMEPDGERSVKLWFEDVSFDVMIGWLANLQQRYGIRAESLDVEARTDAGLVNLRISLVRA